MEGTQYVDGFLWRSVRGLVISLLHCSTAQVLRVCLLPAIKYTINISPISESFHCCCDHVNTNFSAKETQSD